MKTLHYLSVASLILLGSSNAELFGQVECSAPGNLRGIRVDGELMAFSSSIRAVVATATDEGQGGRGRGSGGQFSRDGGALVVTGRLPGGFGRRGGPGGGGPRGGPPPAGVNYRATFKDVAAGTVDAEVEITSTTNTPMEGIFFAIALPGADYTGGSAQMIAPTSTAEPPASLAATGSPGTNLYLRASAKGVRVVSPRRQIELNFPAAVELVIRDVRARTNSDIEVSFPLSLGNLTNGENVHAAFTIKATGEIDKSPARLVLDPSRPGRKYDGMGGNFRIQSPTDAAWIQYNLDNLRIAWGRVAMPLDRWQPGEDADPVEAATTNTLHTSVREAMEMAQKLARKNIPTIISIWSAPGWALATDGGGRGGRARVNPERWDKVCKSIGSYLEYLKQNFRAEPVLFSFNESDMGINVPLLIGEGGLDPDAHQYRAIFLEPWFCLDEIAQYVEICRIAQPLSILHWQLTADYSILTGGTGGRPLQPAQRFWDIKQLGMTAPDSTAMPINCDNPKVISCAFADHGTCVVHLVNNGAARTVTVSGLPAGVKEMRAFVTDSRRGMQETGPVPVVHDTVQLPVDAMSFTSLAGNGEIK